MINPWKSSSSRYWNKNSSWASISSPRPITTSTGLSCPVHLHPRMEARELILQTMTRLLYLKSATLETLKSSAQFQEVRLGLLLIWTMKLNSSNCTNTSAVWKNQSTRIILGSMALLPQWTTIFMATKVQLSMGRGAAPLAAWNAKEKTFRVSFNIRTCHSRVEMTWYSNSVFTGGKKLSLPLTEILEASSILFNLTKRTSNISFYNSHRKVMFTKGNYFIVSLGPCK